FDLPFLFESGEEADAVLDGPFGAQIAEKLASYNLASLGYWELGFRHLTNSRRPVLSVDDIRGLKIRVAQQPIPLALFNQFGANAVPMPFTELHSALESGAIDGQENPATTIL